MKKIMIIDDDHEFLDEITEVLHTHGYIPIPIAAETDAVNVVGTLKPDIILLDLKLGRTSAFIIARDLRKNPLTADVPVIAITGYYTDEEYREIMSACQIRHCLTKPIDIKKLLQWIESETDRSQLP